MSTAARKPIVTHAEMGEAARYIVGLGLPGEAAFEIVGQAVDALRWLEDQGLLVRAEDGIGGELTERGEAVLAMLRSFE